MALLKDTELYCQKHFTLCDAGAAGLAEQRSKKRPETSFVNHKSSFVLDETTFVFFQKLRHNRKTPKNVLLYLLLFILVMSKSLPMWNLGQKFDSQPRISQKWRQN